MVIYEFNSEIKINSFSLYFELFDPELFEHKSLNVLITFKLIHNCVKSIL